MDSAASPADLIATPDRRVRVFVSSTLAELAEERRAARRAVTALRLTPIMFELGARPHPPRELYRSYLAQSDVFVGIYWQRYGWVAPQEPVSGLEDEYLLSGDRPKLMYVKHPAPGREPRLDDLLHRIQTDDRASYKPFSDAAELADLLADDLAVLLTERFSAANRPVADGHPGRLPTPPTPLVGRHAEVEAVAALLRDPATRLVTLVGPGGIGKTRVALDVAVAVQHDFAEVWFVDLAAVTDPALVAGVISATMGVSSQGNRSALDVLSDRLVDRRVLLVLDNFEQILDAAPDVARLLAAAPGVRVLVTSRSVLGLRGEHDVALGPLPTPPADDAGLAEVAASPAAQLFVARAQEVRPGFALTAENAAAVAEVCRRLDGIPLALEVAAARVRLLQPAALLRRLGDRLDLLAGQVDLPQRQRTLRATIDWSHSLLGPDERALFARLSVFASGWTLDGAEAVGTLDGDLDVLETLSALVGQSLVAVDERAEGDPRFHMLDTVREYARERLSERGEDVATWRRLAEQLIRLSEQAGPALSRPQNRTWLALLDDELDNLRAALSRAVEGDEAGTVVRIAAPLWLYWWTRGQLAQMLTLAEQTAALGSSAHLDQREQALLLWCRGAARIALGDVGESVPLLRRFLDGARALGDEELLAHALRSLGLALSYDSSADEPRALLEEAVTISRRTGDTFGIAFALTPLGGMALRDGDGAGAGTAHRGAALRGAGGQRLHARPGPQPAGPGQLPDR